MSDVFVSYNSKDGGVARAVVERLRQKSLEVWFDQDSAAVGDSLSGTIEDGLRDSYAFAILLGETLGPWQSLEVEAGIREYVYQGRPLFPVLLEGADIDKMPMLLRGLVYLDLRGAGVDVGTEIDRLAFAIRSRTSGGFNDHVRELHLFERDFLQVLLHRFSLLGSGGGVELQVKFDHRAPCIATREARRFVRLNTPQFEAEGKKLDLSLKQVYDGERPAFNFKHDAFTFRYASGGTIPILLIDGIEYYCLFLRGLQPIGWNLANGGCNSIEELRDPTRTIVRELQEELIIVDSKAWYNFGPLDDSRLDRPEFAVSRDYWNRRFDKLGLRRFEQLERRLLRIPESEGPDMLTIKYHQSQPITYDSLFVSITTEDYGIEVDRVLVLPLPSEGLVLCDGEINAARSVNRPVGLFRTEGFSASSARLVPDFFFYGAKQYNGEDFDKVVRDQVTPEMSAPGPPLPEHVIPEFKAAARTGFGLCPVALRLISRVRSTGRNR